jgi:hypothetical protein
MLTEKWPVLGRHEQAAVWLQIWTDLGRAPRTIARSEAVADVGVERRVKALPVSAARAGSADPAHVARIAVDGIAPASTRSSQTTSAARSSPGCTEALRRSTRSWSEREWWRTQRDDGVSRVVAGLDR